MELLIPVCMAPFFGLWALFGWIFAQKKDAPVSAFFGVVYIVLFVFIGISIMGGGVGLLPALGILCVVCFVHGLGVASGGFDKS